MKANTIVLHEDRNVTLTTYLQEVGGEFRNVSKRPAILILPGGGYQFCSDREADPIAMPYLKAGYQVFILRYSVGADATWPTPLEDYEEAMTMIRSNAEQWHVYEDKIAVIGFSAGGHLAGAAAAMSKNRPNAAILGYAVVSADVKGCSKTAPDVIPYVDKDTCPCFIFATRTDSVVPIMNSVKMMEALTNADVSYESHIYAYGPHGFATGDHSVQHMDTVICERVPNWVGDSIGWLRDMFGDFGDGCMTTPVCKPHVSGDTDAFLSIDCTMGRIMGNPQAAPIVGQMMGQMQSMMGQDTDDKSRQMAENSDMAAMVQNMKLRDILGFANVGQDVLDGLDEQLSKIPNI